jgi:hypothetical protein
VPDNVQLSSDDKKRIEQLIRSARDKAVTAVERQLYATFESAGCLPSFYTLVESKKDYSWRKLDAEMWDDLGPARKRLISAWKAFNRTAVPIAKRYVKRIERLKLAVKQRKAEIDKAATEAVCVLWLGHAEKDITAVLKKLERLSKL